MNNSNSLTVRRVKHKFHYADFHRNFPVGKVVDTNHESREHKPVSYTHLTLPTNREV